MGDLDGAQLAEYANGRITLDIDAAGNGWLVNASPRDDHEFSGRGSVQVAGSGSAAAGGMDLLSALAHEMGHALGLGHTDGGVMDELLRPGQRATPERWHDALRDAARPTPTAAVAAPVAIDWSAVAYGEPARAGSDYGASAPTTSVTDWRQRFVNDLGRSPEAASPNATMRVFVPVSSSATVAVRPRLTSL